MLASYSRSSISQSRLLHNTTVLHYYSAANEVYGGGYKNSPLEATGNTFIERGQSSVHWDGSKFSSLGRVKVQSIGKSQSSVHWRGSKFSSLKRGHRLVHWMGRVKVHSSGGIKVQSMRG